jgi:hypothetical protein
MVIARLLTNGIDSRPLQESRQSSAAHRRTIWQEFGAKMPVINFCGVAGIGKELLVVGTKLTTHQLGRGRHFEEELPFAPLQLRTNVQRRKYGESWKDRASHPVKILWVQY